MGGVFRFLQRFWTLSQEYLESKPSTNRVVAEKDILQITHKAIKSVSKDLNELGLNTAIASLMESVNELYKIKAEHGFMPAKTWKFAMNIHAQLLAPFAPHIAEELWHQLGNKESVHTSEWPVHDEEYLVTDKIIIVVQVNGKVRANIEMPSDSSEETIVEAAKEDKKVASYLKDKKLHKTIYVAGKLVNLVVS